MKKLMHKIEPIMLCLDPGTREMGVAVLEGRDLVDYHVVTFRNGRKPRELLNQNHQAILTLLDRVHPDVVVIERPFFAKTKRSALLVFLVQELKRQVRLGRFQLVEYSPLEVRERLLGDRRATKRDIARHVGRRFSQLGQHLHFGEFWKEKYWSHVFDAVALGLVAFERRSTQIHPPNQPASHVRKPMGSPTHQKTPRHHKTTSGSGRGPRDSAPYSGHLGRRL